MVSQGKQRCLDFIIIIYIIILFIIIIIYLQDTICTSGIATTAGSAVLAGFKPSFDATCVIRLKAAGANILGKVNCDQFAMGSTTETSSFKVRRLKQSTSCEGSKELFQKNPSLLQPN